MQSEAVYYLSTLRFILTSPLTVIITSARVKNKILLFKVVFGPFPLPELLDRASSVSLKLNESHMLKTCNLKTPPILATLGLALREQHLQEKTPNSYFSDALQNS